MPLWRGGTRRPRSSTCQSKRWPSLWMICHVSCTLLVIGMPIDHIPSTFTRATMKILLMTRLGISIEEKAIATTTVGARVRLSWLVDLYYRYPIRIVRMSFHNLSFALGRHYNICRQVLDSHLCRLPPLRQQPGWLSLVCLGVTALDDHLYFYFLYYCD